LFSPSRFRGFPGRAAARYPAEAFPAAFFFCDFLGEAAAPKPMLFPRGCVSTRPLRSARSGAKRAIIFCPAKKKKGDRAARVNSAHRWTQRTAAVFFEVQLCARARDGSTTAAKQRRPGDSEKRRASCENTRAPRVLSTKAHDRDKGISYFKGPPFLSDHLERKRERSALPCRDYRRFPPVSILRHAAIRLQSARSPNQWPQIKSIGAACSHFSVTGTRGNRFNESHKQDAANPFDGIIKREIKSIDRQPRGSWRMNMDERSAYVHVLCS